jgi:Putative zinc-finger
MIPYVGCEYAREHLDGFVDGELAVDEQVAVESHLRWCRTCAARIEDLQLIGDSIRLGSLAPRGDDEESRTISHVQASVLIRVRAEEEMSFASRFRDMFTDMRLLWPALGATSAVTVGLALALSVLHSTTLERPESLATMLETLSDPGGDRNPLMPGNTARYDRLFLRYVDSDRAGGISMPRALDDGTVFESIPEQDATFAVAAVVSRDGRIANYELLNSERSGRQGRNMHANDVEMLDAAVRQSRFAPAQTPVGRAVAVNMVWLIVMTTVQTPEPRAIRVPPSVAPTNRVPPAEPIEEAPLKRSDLLETSTTA